MQETRRLRLQTVIQEEVAQMVSREVRDPRIPPVTFTAVEVDKEASQAVIYVSILGGAKNERQMKDCLKGLSSARGFLRRHLTKVLNIRHTPELVFKEDRGLENASRVYDLLKQIGADPTKDSSEEE